MNIPFCMYDQLRFERPFRTIRAGDGPTVPTALTPMRRGQARRVLVPDPDGGVDG